MPLARFSFVSLLAQPTAEQDRTILLRLTLGLRFKIMYWAVGSAGKPRG